MKASSKLLACNGIQTTKLIINEAKSTNIMKVNIIPRTLWLNKLKLNEITCNSNMSTTAKNNL